MLYTPPHMPLPEAAAQYINILGAVFRWGGWGWCIVFWAAAASGSLVIVEAATFTENFNGEFL